MQPPGNLTVGMQNIDWLEEAAVDWIDTVNWPLGLFKILVSDWVGAGDWMREKRGKGNAVERRSRDGVRRGNGPSKTQPFVQPIPLYFFPALERNPIEQS